jgi:hypothetical protein
MAGVYLAPRCRSSPVSHMSPYVLLLAVMALLITATLLAAYARTEHGFSRFEKASVAYGA